MMNEIKTNYIDKIELTRDELTNQFYINKDICDQYYYYFSNLKSLEDEKSNLLSIGYILVKRLFNIEDIKFIFLEKNKLTIKKTLNSTWEELNNQIKNIINFTIEEFYPSEAELKFLLRDAETIMNIHNTYL